MSDWQTGATITGPYLVARNSASTGIHSDEFAQNQGFKRAIVAGPNHLTFASTLLEQELGERWLEHGRLQVRFTSPVYDQDQVRVVFTVNGTGEALAADYQLENANAVMVASGSAAWTPAGGEATVTAPPPSSPADELLDLRALVAGEQITEDQVIARGEEVSRFCQQNHDQLARPGRVPSSYLSPLLFGPARRFLNQRGVGPGMWGEIDIRQYRPLQTDTPYRYEGTVLSCRRRGNLEIVDFLFTARDPNGQPLCAISHTHLIPHRDRTS